MAKGFGFSVKKLAEVSAVWPAFAKAWPVIKAECGTSQRSPKYVYFTSESHPMAPNDDSCAKRFVVELATGKVLDSVHVSCGENALMNSRGEAKAVTGVPAGFALVSCEWSDFHRTFSMDVQSAEGTMALPAHVPALGA